MKELSAADLKQWAGEQKPFLLLDVREPYEHEHFNIGGLLIPLGELISRRNEIDKSRPVVVYCEKGIRSIIAIQRLEAFGFEQLYNLQGGMKAYKASPAPDFPAHS